MKGLRHLGLCLLLTLACVQPLFAAFPQVQTTNNNVTSSGTSHVLTLPTGVASGNLLIAIVSETLGTTITTPGDWTELSNTAQGGTMRLVVAAKIAGASESNPTFNTGSSTALHYVIYRIDSWHGTAMPEVGTAVGAATSTPNPPSVTASWGSSDNLFIAVAANDSAGTVSVIPTNYSNEVSQTSGAIISTARRELAAASDDPGTFTHSVSDDTVAQTIVVRPVAATLEQEGFRWGVDDGTESTHGWEADQDTNITIAANQSRLLRVLVNATLDPSAIAYTLRYQKNGSGGYVPVPVGATTKTTPVIETGDATESGSNTASSSWTVNYPNASTGDLLIFCISWDDSTNTTDVTEPAGPNSEVLSEINATPATDAGTNIRAKCWYTVATGTWTASTLTFTPSASEQRTAAVIRVPAGEFDAGTPIGASDTEGAASAGTNVNHGAFSAGASDGSGKLCVWTAVDANPQTVASGFTQIANTDRGAVSGGFFTRDTAVSDSESFSATAAATITSEDWATVAFVVRAPSVTNEVYITTSANIAAGGEATTARLTAPSGKTTSDFVAGRRWDDENGTDTIDITTDDYTEVEWLVFLANTLVANDYEEFRVYAGNNALDTYTVTPRWTIPGGGAAAPPLRALIGVGH